MALPVKALHVGQDARQVAAHDQHALVTEDLIKTRQALMVVERGATICVLATDPASNRYPAFHTVRMCRGRAGSASSFRRSSPTWVSSVRLITLSW